jgi:hypothetical protein
MPNLMILLAIFGLAFFVKQSDGPFDLMARLRSALMRNKWVGVFFFKLLDCFFCTGCWSGWAIYLLLQWRAFLWTDCFVWGLAGGTVCLLGDGLLNWLHKE